MPNTFAKKCSGNTLEIARSDTKQELQSLAFGTLIHIGLRDPDLALFHALPEGVSATLIGDALAPGLIQAAVFSGHKAAMEFETTPGERVHNREAPILYV